MRKANVELSVEFVRHTDKAILVRYDASEVWLPKSQIEDEEEFDWDAFDEDDDIDIIIPEWLAEEKGLW